MGLNFYYYDGLQPKRSAGMIKEHECIAFLHESLNNFKIHLNLFKYLFTLWHFAMDDPVHRELSLKVANFAFEKCHCDLQRGLEVQSV